MTPRQIAAGVTIGIVYVLSPLTIWFTVAMAMLLRWLRGGLDGEERSWATTIVVAGILTRVAAVVVLFAVTDHATVPFGHFFGDEEYFIRRSIWLRNVALGIPVHGADLIYAFDDYSQTSYLYILAFVQILVGPSPYGVHLLAIGCHVAGCVLMYSVARPALGRIPALAGLVLLLFLPSLFSWSVSALKDPIFFLLTASSLKLAVMMVRGRSWPARVASLAVIAVLIAGIETVRPGGLVLTGGGLIAGLVIALWVSRPRWLIATMVTVPLVLGFVLSEPALQIRVYSGLRLAAKHHWGHVATPGYVYRLLDPRQYEGLTVVDELEFGEAARFVVRALTRYVTVPLPWEARSTAALAYLPEQLVWWLIVALAPFGIIGSFRRDVPVTSLLLGYALVGAVIVAMTSGNVGTLVRHRGLALPYLVWLSAVGACDAIRWLARRGAASQGPASSTGTLTFKVQPTWR
jgi:hypothetical protein